MRGQGGGYSAIKPPRAALESETLNPLFAQPCAIVDLETTGGHISRDRITEVGVILIDGDRVERFSSLINPGQPIPPFIENMTGISNAMVAEAPNFSDLAERLLSMLSGRLFLAHNARFDYSFLKNEFRRVGLRFQSQSLCTVKLSRRLYPQFFKHSLDSLIERHDIRLPERHRALADAEAVRRFLDIAHLELGAETMGAAMAAVLAAPPELAGLPAALQDQLELLPDVPGVYTLYGEDGKPLYVGRGNNLRNRVLAHFVAVKGGGKSREVHIGEPIGRVEWQETLGDFGAHLLELQRIHALAPRHNHRGKLSPELCSIQLVAEDGFIRPKVVYARELDFSRTADLYGLFRHAREARKILAEIALGNALCQSVLGVEAVTSRKGAPCAALKLGRCRGACVGREPAEVHDIRLLGALAKLKVKAWPFAGAIAVVETDEVTGERAEHVFDRWCYLGSRQGEGGPLEGAPSFDLDSYKLLEGWLRKPVEGTALREL